MALNATMPQSLVEYREMLTVQKEFFATNATKTIEWRVEQLNRLHAMLSENHQRFLDAVGKDFKSSVYEQYFEVDAVIGTIEATKEQLADWMKPVDAPVPKFLRETGHKGIVYREPYGVALVMGPFNGPMILSLHPLIAAFSAGNTAFLKMPEAIPATTGLLGELVPKYFKPECLVTMRGHRDKVNELLTLPFDFIFFTGSTSAGKTIAKAAAENLIPVVLELGGQNPAIVDETANIKDAARKLSWGKTAWAGQWCTSPGYVCVHESVADEFVQACKEAMTEFYGSNFKASPDFSKIVSPKETQRLAGLIDPAKVVVGGQTDIEGRYVDPTVLYPVTWSDKVMEAEIFGPILPILTYKSFDDVLKKIKTLPKALSGFIFSRDKSRIDKFINDVSFGGGAVNQTNVHLFIETMPFGGVGLSGVGNYYGKYGFDSLTHAKAMLVSPPDVSIEQLLPPYTEQKIKDWSKWFEY